MSDLDPLGRALLDTARAARPSAAARARIDAGLAARLAAPPASPPDPPAPPAAAPAGIAGLAAGPLAKLVVLGALLGAGAGAIAWLRPAPPVQAQLVAAPTPSAVAPPPPQPSAAPSAPPEPTPPATVASSASPARGPARRRDTPAPPASVDPPAPPASLEGELALLRGAQRSLKGGDGAEALAQLDALAQRYPTGVLREERLAARVLALCAAGRVEEAREAGRRFVAELPASVQAPRVRASCAFAPGHGER
jgi:hypothetical protein